MTYPLRLLCLPAARPGTTDMSAKLCSKTTLAMRCTGHAKRVPGQTCTGKVLPLSFACHQSTFLACSAAGLHGCDGQVSLGGGL